MSEKGYVIDLSFSVMRFLESNEAVNTSIISNYTLIKIKEREFKEVYEDLQEDFTNLIKKYAEKYPFKP